VEHAVLPLTAWESFYVIVGSSAAALTGLQFVVMTLSSEFNIADEGTTRAFGTPTIVHFCAVLLLSALLSAPWQSMSNLAAVLVICGVAGLVYTSLVIRHTRRQRSYKPVLEDWIWHSALPLIAYGVLFVTALTLDKHPHSSLFTIAATSLLLLFIGIHNAWDAVTYVAIQRRPRGKAAEGTKGAEKSFNTENRR